MNDSEEIIPVKAGLYCRNFFFSRKISFLSFFFGQECFNDVAHSLVWYRSDSGLNNFNIK